MRNGSLSQRSCIYPLAWCAFTYRFFVWSWCVWILKKTRVPVPRWSWLAPTLAGIDLTGLQQIKFKQEEATFISHYLIVIQGLKKRGLPSKSIIHLHLSQDLACLCAPSFFSLNRVRNTHWKFMGLYLKSFSNAELPLFSQPFSFVLCSCPIVSDEVSLIQSRDDAMHFCEYSCSCTHVYIIHAWFLHFTLKCIIQTNLYIL